MTSNDIKLILLGLAIGVGSAVLLYLVDPKKRTILPKIMCTASVVILLLLVGQYIVMTPNTLEGLWSEHSQHLSRRLMINNWACVFIGISVGGCGVLLTYLRKYL